MHASAAPIRAALLAALLGSVPAAAQIQDNSFLLEEAYNQESGVVQHLATFERAHPGGGWALAFTQEWPLLGRQHQFSYTVPFVRAASGSAAGLGDVTMDYRYQLMGDGDARLAIAPRASLLLPLGDENAGRGTGRIGAELGLPVSVALTPTLVAHTNAALGFLVQARQEIGPRNVAVQASLGQSVVWLAHPRVNLLVEGLWERLDEEDSAREDVESLFISPGIRGKFDVGPVEVVPGFAVPIGVGTSDGERSLLFYLSLEHAFR